MKSRVPEPPRALRWLRRMALGLCAFIFALSGVAIFSSGKGPMLNFTGVDSVVGALLFLDVHQMPAPPAERRWHTELTWLSEYEKHFSTRGAFNWKGMGFQFRSNHGVASVSRPAY